jgi:hypothetical protein
MTKLALPILLAVLSAGCAVRAPEPSLAERIANIDKSCAHRPPGQERDTCKLGLYLIEKARAEREVEEARNERLANAIRAANPPEPAPRRINCIHGPASSSCKLQ